MSNQLISFAKTTGKRYGSTFLIGGAFFLALSLLFLAVGNFGEANTIKQEIATCEQALALGEKNLVQLAEKSLPERGMDIIKREEVPNFQDVLIKNLRSTGELELLSLETVPEATPKVRLSLGASRVVESYWKISTSGYSVPILAFLKWLESLPYAKEMETLTMETVAAVGKEGNVVASLGLTVFVLEDDRGAK